MHTFWQTARFELRYHLRQPGFYLFYALTVVQGFAYALGSWQAGGYAQTNAPSLFFDVFSSVGVLLTALSALLTGQSLLRDRTYRVGNYLYALPLDERLYFAGKFVGVLGTCVLLATGVVLGTLALPLWASGAICPFPVAAVAYGFVVLLVPNLLIVVSLAYALTAFSQRMAGAYVALLVLVVGQVLLQIGEATVAGNDLLLVLDPFGHVLVRDALSQQLPAEQLAGTLPVPDLMLINRLLWLGLSGGLLVRATDRLTFEHWAATETNSPKPTVETAKSKMSQLVDVKSVTPATRSFSRLARIQTFGQLTVRDFRSVVRQPAFLVVGLLLVLTIIGYATGLGNLNDSGQRLLPFTSRMTYVRLPLLGFIGLFLIVFMGELLHRERSTGMWPLLDVLPKPTWLFLLAKYVAMLGVAGLLTGTLLLTGVTMQLINGQTPLDWSLYARDLLLDGWLRYVQVLSLTFFVQVLITNRLTGQLASAVLFLTLLLFDKTGLNGSWLTVFSSLPRSWTYSELTGYSGAESVRLLYALMWTLGAAGLLLLALNLGQRGVVVPIQTIGRRWRATLRPGYMVWLGAVSAGVIVSQVYLRFPEQQSLTNGDNVPIAYRQATQTVLAFGKPIMVRYRYVHDQNLARMQAAVAHALTQGTAWLGTFPTQDLTISEVPFNQPARSSSPAHIDLGERDGWLTDTRQSADASAFDLGVTQAIIRHWVQSVSINNQFITRGLPDYLALRIVQQQRGDGWLATELTHLQRIYRTGRGQSNAPEPTLLQPNLPRYVSEARGPVSLTCIGEVWGHDRLCRQVGQFVQNGGQKTARGYVIDLIKALPDSLTYLTAHLGQRPLFDFRVGPVGIYSDRMSAQFLAQKYQADSVGHLREQLLNDHVPVVLLDKDGRVIYRQLIIANTAGRTDKVDWLPFYPNAVAVQIDPLGAWPEVNKRDNVKRLGQL